MPRKKVPCPECGQMKKAEAKVCRDCSQPYERTIEHCEAMSQALKGKRHNWRSGSTRPEVAAKIAASWTPEMRQAAQKRGLLRAADRTWRDLIALSVSGQLNPNYQGKDNATPYAPGWGRLHKRLIRERNGYRCVDCGREGRFDIHHIDGSKDNHHPDNLVHVCRKCHKARHRILAARC